MRLKRVDRNTPMLLPPDLRDWVREDDLVHFVIEAVERLPLHRFALNVKGCGDAQYSPLMMLALLIYCYANGIFSSRRIERATHRDLAVRYLCAGQHPDHDTLCAFRRKNMPAIAEAFVSVLELARELGLLKLGGVSMDGTHLKANASKDKNVTYARAQQLREQLRLDVAELLEKAEKADGTAEDAQALPGEIARREKLLEKMELACARLEARAKADAASQQADYQRTMAARESRSSPCPGPVPQPPQQTPEPDQQINLTDPEAHLMRKSMREGYTQSYNAQAVVDIEGSQLIVGQRVSTCVSDSGHLEPDLDCIPASLGQPHTALADCGFASKKVFQHLQETRPGLDLYVSVHSEHAHAERAYDYRPPEKIKAPRKITHPVLVTMAEKLKTPQGKELYRKRSSTVEPVFGIIKSAMGFRQFSLRGLSKVSGEWSLVCLTYNLKRLHVLRQASSLN